MRHTGRWFPVTIVLALGVAAAWLFAAPTFEEAQLTALADADPTVRETAVGELAAQATMSDLLYELGQEHASLVKSGLAEAVRRKGVTSGEVSSLTGLLTSEHADTRHLAVGLLEPVASNAFKALEEVATDEKETTLVRAAAVGVLGSAGAQARGVFLGLLRDEDLAPTVRYAAMRSLAVVSSDGVADIQGIAADKGRDWADRTQAIQALAQKAAAGEGALVALTGSKEIAVRRHAVLGLAARGSAGVSATLAGLLIDPAADVRLGALQGLEVLHVAGPNRLAIVPRLLDLDVRVQATAARLVGQTCASMAATVIPTLKGLLVSTSFRVRYEAALALSALGDKSGAATMLADQATPNAAQAQMAAQAYKQITGV